jgi:hypothetical protein
MVVSPLIERRKDDSGGTQQLLMSVVEGKGVGRVGSKYSKNNLTETGLYDRIIVIMWI